MTSTEFCVTGESLVCNTNELSTFKKWRRAGSGLSFVWVLLKIAVVFMLSIINIRRSCRPIRWNALIIYKLLRSLFLSNSWRGDLCSINISSSWMDWVAFWVEKIQRVEKMSSQILYVDWILKVWAIVIYNITPENGWGFTSNFEQKLVFVEWPSRPGSQVTHIVQNRKLHMFMI